MSNFSRAHIMYRFWRRRINNSPPPHPLTAGSHITKLITLSKFFTQHQAALGFAGNMLVFVVCVTSLAMQWRAQNELEAEHDTLKSTQTNNHKENQKEMKKLRAEHKRDKRAIEGELGRIRDGMGKQSRILEDALSKFSK